jgi:hypothetical protein
MRRRERVELQYIYLYGIYNDISVNGNRSYSKETFKHRKCFHRMKFIEVIDRYSSKKLRSI